MKVRIRWSLRFALLTTTAICILLGVWVVCADSQRQTVGRIEALGASIHEYDYLLPSSLEPYLGIHMIARARKASFSRPGGSVREADTAELLGELRTLRHLQSVSMADHPYEKHRPEIEKRLPGVEVQVFQIGY